MPIISYIIYYIIAIALHVRPHTFSVELRAFLNGIVLCGFRINELRMFHPSGGGYPYIVSFPALVDADYSILNRRLDQFNSSSVVRSVVHKTFLPQRLLVGEKHRNNCWFCSLTLLSAFASGARTPHCPRGGRYSDFPLITIFVIHVIFFRVTIMY